MCEVCGEKLFVQMSTEEVDCDETVLSEGIPKYNKNILVEKVLYFFCFLISDPKFHYSYVRMFTLFTTSWFWAVARVRCRRELLSKLDTCYDHLLRIN